MRSKRCRSSATVMTTFEQHNRIQVDDHCVPLGTAAADTLESTLFDYSSSSTFVFTLQPHLLQTHIMENLRSTPHSSFALIPLVIPNTADCLYSYHEVCISQLLRKTSQAIPTQHQHACIAHDVSHDYTSHAQYGGWYHYGNAYINTIIHSCFCLVELAHKVVRDLYYSGLRLQSAIRHRHFGYSGI